MPTIIIVILVIFAFLLVIWIGMTCPRIFRRPNRKPFMKYWYAHRGYHDNNSEAPENSLPAFRKAVEMGFGIELDVQLTKDEQVVVFHDNDLKRVCGVDAPVNSMTYEELLKLSLLETNEKIPLFTEVLQVVDGKVPLIVEIKMVDSKTRVCELANEILLKYNGLYCVESFHPYAVRWFGKNRPELLRGQLSSDFGTDTHKESFGEFMVHYLLSNMSCRPDFISYDCLHPNNIGFITCKLLGALPVTWTVKTPNLLMDVRRKFKLFIFEGFNPLEYDSME